MEFMSLLVSTAIKGKASALVIVTLGGRSLHNGAAGRRGALSMVGL